MPRNTPGKKSVSVTMPVETYESIRAWADEKEWSVAKASFKLIEMGLEQLAHQERRQPQPAEVTASPQNPSTDTQTQQSAPEDVPTRRAKRMSGAGFMALVTSKQVQESYYELLSSNKIGHQRLKALASGDKPTEKELHIIREVLSEND